MQSVRLGKFEPLVCAAFLSLAPLAATSHPGGLDKQGCHTNRKTSDYHCHRDPARDAAGPKVKKSRSGICHDRSSPWYDQTIHFEPFNTLKECLDSGGRLPNS